MTGRFSLDNPWRQTFRYVLELQVDRRVGSK